MGFLYLHRAAIGVCLLLVLATTANAGKRRKGAADDRPAADSPADSSPEETALPGNALFKPGETSATFQLSEVGEVGKPSPELELLFSTDNQQAIATLLKAERNKSFKPGLILPDDKNARGIKIRFDAIRLLRIANQPDLVRVRLVGPVNEIECKEPLSISKLIRSDEPIPVQFQSVTRTSGVTVTITTDMKLRWNDGNLDVLGTRGSIDFSVGLLSPARLFYANDLDSVKLPDLYGKRVKEDALVQRSLLEPEKL